jgi:hypothetical protein
VLRHAQHVNLYVCVQILLSVLLLMITDPYVYTPMYTSHILQYYTMRANANAVLCADVAFAATATELDSLSGTGGSVTSTIEAAIA